MDSRDHLELCDLFADASSSTSRAWIISDDDMQMTKNVVGEIASGQQSLQIIDLFSKKQPLIYNYRYVILGQNQVFFRPIILCDSNVLSLLVRFVVAPQRLSSDDFIVAKTLLAKILLERLDVLNLLSGRSIRSLIGKGYVSIDRAQETFLRILTMNAERFLSTGEIVDSIPLRHSVEDAYSAGNLIEIARLQTESAKLSPIVLQCEMIYACLLEMVWIHRANHRGLSIEDKVKMLRDFMTDTVGRVSALVMLLAPEYFANLLNSFISFQSNSNADRQFRRLKAAAWDIYLLSLPGIFLGEGDQDGAAFAFICTGDKAFAAMARRVQVSSVFASSSALPIVVYTYDYQELKEQIGAQRLADLENSSLEFSRERQRRPKNLRKFPQPKRSSKAKRRFAAFPPSSENTGEMLE